MTISLRDAKNMTPSQMADWVEEVMRANGWFEFDRSWGDDMALLQSEVSEMFEAYRDKGYEDMTQPQSHSVECWLLSGPRSPEEKCTCGAPLSKPLGFGSECADVLVRALDTLRRQGSDIDKCMAGWADRVAPRELEHYKTAGDRISFLTHVISRCWEDVSPEYYVPILICFIDLWCRENGIDLLAEFNRKMEYNATRGYRHGNKLV